MIKKTQASLVDRANYASLSECIYLNQASLGLLSETAVLTMHDFLDNTARHGNLHMSDADEVAFFSTLREQAARLLHCDEPRLAIISSAGEMLSQLPYLFAPPAGSEIVAIATDFPAVTRPWLLYAAENSLRVEFVEDSPDWDLTETLIERIGENTAVVAISQVQFSTGTVLDIPRLRGAAERVGARVIVDVTQSAGGMRLDTRSWDADVVVSSGYKWLGGHGGIALAVLSPQMLERKPIAPGWMGAPDPFDFDATSLHFAKGARRYTQSTMAYVSMTGLCVSIAEQLLLPRKTIEHHTNTLANMLVERAETSGWVPFRPLDDVAASKHIVALSHPQIKSHLAAGNLRDQGIICGSRNGRIRVSIAPYNDESDIDALVNVLANL